MDTTSQERLQQWEANLQLASNNMIRQLIEIAQEAYEKSRKEVDQLNKLIEEANWGDITVKNYEILNNNIDHYEQDIIQRKNRKFRRDLTDYQLAQEAYEKSREEVDQLNKRIEEANWGDIKVKNYEILNNNIDHYEEDIIQRKNRKF
ncbi:hypothetical protein NDU88_003360 [Pleurodeles waltl]|uniref:Uncharacterized protein n=1 Tax=Pleurodeles waltl TaxID=8319 RepID=A0AAV7UY81_PLEWA|nr:hypothetical protein NDU88_003360 [Pleurodeles waltl]